MNSIGNELTSSEASRHAVFVIFCVFTHLNMYVV